MESSTEPTSTESDEEPWRKGVSKLLGSKAEGRPIITCECALWGSPCPHSFWSKKRATTAISNKV